MKHSLLTIALLAITLARVALANETQPDQPPALVEDIHSTLNAFHLSASEANGDTYFGLLHEDAVFIGTDASERWTKAQFERFALPYFSERRGWTYHPRDRHVSINKAGDIAWFDEMLDNESYGECRGTGVLLLTEDGWKISQYHLTIPIPNVLAKDVVKQIRNLK